MASVRNHLIARHCNPDLYGNSLVIDENERVATFLLWNFSGQLIGYQQYRPDNHEKAVKNHPDKRYYLYVGDEGEIYNKSKRKLAVFGIETLKMFPNSPILLTEGIFNAARLHSAGFAALGLLSNNPKKITTFLKIVHGTKIAICDGDKAGQQLAKYGDYSIHLPDGTDVNDLDLKRFVELTTVLRKYDRFKQHIDPDYQSGEILPRSITIS